MRQLLNGPHTKVRASGDTSGADIPLGYGLSGTPPGGQATPQKGRKQQGMMQFFKQNAKCLGCKRVLPKLPGSGGLFGKSGPATPDSGRGPKGRLPGSSKTPQPTQKGVKGDAHSSTPDVSRIPPLDPGLCDECKAEDGKWCQVYLNILADDNAAEEALCHATSACVRCHSGGLLGPVICENGECPVLYERYAAARKAYSSQHKLMRMEW